MKLVGSNSCSNLDRTIYRSDCGSLIKHTGNNKLDMLTVSIRIQADETTHNLKTFRVAAGVRGATLRHRMCASNHSWFTQVMDFFDVMDYPVAGYNPPGVITELHMHFWDCAVDYRPLHLPLKSMITVGTFSVSSNIAAQTNSSTLRFIAEDAALFITDKIGAKYQSSPVDLRKDYVCVVDLGLFELSLRLCDKTSGQNSDSPRVDLRASNNVLHVHTCSDSAKALTELLIYFSMDGDMLQSDSQCSHSKCDQILVNTGNIPVDDNQNDSNNLSKSQVDHVHHLMEEAMKDTHGTHQGEKSESSTFAGERRGGVEVFFFPDENHPLPARLLGDSEMNRPIEDDDDDDWEDDFCILEKEAGSGIMYLKNGLPELRTLTPEPVRMVDNHFSLPLGKMDLLKAPKHYPAAVLRYTLCEMSIVWHMYGGKDFSMQPPKKQVKLLEKHRSGTAHVKGKKDYGLSLPLLLTGQ
uniref:Autophagy-related protein 2 n=1 Tax=Timema monikensis TaxID=170555 RepID=A0A7R9EK65_9NEOP|nr:unnamed protein product [Timema monikensis]